MSTRKVSQVAVTGPGATARCTAAEGQTVTNPAPRRQSGAPRPSPRRSSLRQQREAAGPCAGRWAPPRMPPRPWFAGERALTRCQATASPSAGRRAPLRPSGVAVPEAAGSPALALRSAPHVSSCPRAVLGRRAWRCTAPRWSRSQRSSKVARAPMTGSGQSRSRPRTSGRLPRRGGGKGRGASAHPVRTPLASSERRRCCTSRDPWRSSPSTDRGRRRSWTAPQPPRI